MLPDLQTAVDSGQPVLKVDSIKYVYTFRNQVNELIFNLFKLILTYDI
jgi:hypothetical protein